MFSGTAFVTGSNRGIGLEFVKQILHLSKPKHIIATCRNPSKAELYILLDLLNHEDYNKIQFHIQNLIGDSGLNLLFNNAGIAHKSTRLHQVHWKQLTEAYAVNTVAQLKVVQAALNAMTKSLSIDLKPDDILVVSIHPGWVRTNLGGDSAPMSVNESVTAIIQMLHALNESHNGCFLQHDGTILPW